MILILCPNLIKARAQHRKKVIDPMKGKVTTLRIVKCQHISDVQKCTLPTLVLKIGLVLYERPDTSSSCSAALFSKNIEKHIIGSTVALFLSASSWVQNVVNSPLNIMYVA